jgi:hypothetical protein
MRKKFLIGCQNGALVSVWMWYWTTLAPPRVSTSQSWYHCSWKLSVLVSLTHGRVKKIIFFPFSRTGLILLKYCKNRPWCVSEKDENRPTLVAVHYTKPPRNSGLHSFKFQEDDNYVKIWSPVTYKNVNITMEAAFWHDAVHLSIYHSGKLKLSTWMVEFVYF